MEFRILGPLEIGDGERVLALGGSKRRAVAALLLLHANRVVAADQLIDGVWGDEPPPSAAGSLQNHVLRLRRELGDRLLTRAPGYLIRTEPGELDLERFRRLVDEARAADPGDAARLLREALALWRGAPLADLAGEPAAAAAAHLGEARLEALERRIAADLALGRQAEVIAELEQLVAEEPFRERFRAQLVLALYRSGRQADALAAYGDARVTLVEQLGAEPGEELQELQRAILRQDPALGGPAAPPAGAESRVEPSRKTVTVLLGDLAVEGADPEARREGLRAVREQALAAVAGHGGEPGHTSDERVLGLFGVPVASDDDALRAVRAACELRAGGVVTRAGVATGDVITGDRTQGDPLVSGPPLEEADRLRAAAEAHEVLLGSRTWRLVRHAVDAVVRDGLHSVTAVVADEAVARRLDTPFVGREDELDEIVAAFWRVEREGRARLVTVFGSPGVGKTRLARETIDRLGAVATCLVGRTPGGDAPTYAPLRDALEPVAGGSVRDWAAAVLMGDPDAGTATELVAAAVGEAGSTGPVDETAWAFRRLLEALGAGRPVVLVLEDLHWARPTFLDLVEHVAGLARAPILILGLARPDLLDTRPDWAGGRLNASTILLDSLAQSQARALLDVLTADTALNDERRHGILTAAGGNPLFLEQLVAAARDRDDAAIPDSIHALLAARLDRLGDDERQVVQAASVLGQSFPATIVEKLVGREVRRPLLTLARRDFVEPDAPRMPGEDRWAFRHALLRDEAYASIPKRRRASLHVRTADVVAELAAGRGLDVEELIGRHLEAAHAALAEVDGAAPELPQLADDAAAHLAAAGLRAYGELDVHTAADLLSRAAALLAPGDASRMAFVPQLADVLSWIGRREEALRILDEAEASADSADEHIRARLLVARCNLALWGSPARDAEEVLADLRTVMPVLEAAGDDETLAQAYIVMFQSWERFRGLGPLDEEHSALVLAAERARAAGARSMESMAASWLCVIVRRGPWPLDRALEIVERTLEHPPTRFAYASALGGLAGLRAMDGRFEEARRLAAESHAIFEDAGLPQNAAADLIGLAEIDMLAGDDQAAEPVLREAIDRLDAVGDGFSLVNAAWRLALLLAGQGRDDEAAFYVERAGEADAGLVVTGWRTVILATIAAHRGDVDEVRRLLAAADEAISHLYTGIVADMTVQAAEAAALAGLNDEAAGYLRRAVEITERLGYRITAERARERLDALGYAAETA